jgi:hypothetical protein
VPSSSKNRSAPCRRNTRCARQPSRGRASTCCSRIPARRFPRSLRLIFSAGFENDPDEGIVLPRVGTVIGTSWTEGLSNLQTGPFDELREPGMRRLKKLFAKDIVWILAVPIFRILEGQDAGGGQEGPVPAENPKVDDGQEPNESGVEGAREPALVVAVDGSAALNEDDVPFERVLDVLSTEIENIFGPMADTLEQISGDGS